MTEVIMTNSHESKSFTGILLIEEVEGSEKFTSRFFRLNKEIGQLEYFTDDPVKSADSLLIGSFNLQFLSLVEDASVIRPKLTHGFYIMLCGQKHFLAASNDEERSNWIKAIVDSFKTSDAQLRYRFSSGNCNVDSSTILGFDDSLNKTGYCVKQGLKRKNWKRRFFVLDSYGLAYYISDEETSPIKLIKLSDICQARISVGIHLHRANVFEVVTPQRVFYIQADSAFERESWINAINRGAGSFRRSQVKSIRSTASQACITSQ